MKQKMYILYGPPACGKSTKAQELHQQDPKNVIICRDSIRDMRGQYWIPEQENWISEVELTMVTSALNQGLNPVIDATNCNSKTREKWESICKEFNIDYEYIECVIPYIEACKRDKERGSKVGNKVIKDFYQKYYPELLPTNIDDRFLLNFHKNKPKAIICDLDGTLALHQGRDPYDYSLIATDKIDHRLAHLLKSILCNCEYEIIFISGRENINNCRKLTKEWLAKNFQQEFWYNRGIPEPNWQLFQRAAGDTRSEEIIKQELYNTYIEPWFDVVAVFDDRNSSVEMWRSLGILCCQVYDGKF